MIERSSVVHMSSYHFAYPIDENTLAVRLIARCGDLNKVEVLYKNLYDHQSPMNRKEMGFKLCDGLHDVFEIEISVVQKRFKYYFCLYGEEETIYFTSDGFLDNPTEKNSFFVPYINPDEIVRMPQWAHGEIIYQVLVDRFYDGDKSNNPAGVKPWDTIPDRSTYYGGDFKGLTEKLDYIASLGAKMIYLSPVFSSPTYHKYDIDDYYNIESIYGGEKDLITLVENAHKKGIKIILDGVFNHCSIDNPLFKDVIEKGEKSQYADWFCVLEYPVDINKCNYESFADLVSTMPRFNTSNPKVIEYLTDSAVYWTKKLNIDGWRLDVADEISHDFLMVFRKRIKEANPQAIIIGEIWNNAQQWLLGKEMDTCTNYKFRNALLSLAKGTEEAKSFWHRIAQYLTLYKTPYYGYLINLIGSHDTERICSVMQGEENAFPVIVAMLAFEGIPLIYYGDECGIMGGEDPDNRRAMPWEKINEDFAIRVREMANFRSKNTVLKLGTTQPVELNEPKVLAFLRIYGDEKLFIAINFAQEDAVVEYEVTKRLIGNGEIDGREIIIPPKGYIIAQAQ